MSDALSLDIKRSALLIMDYQPEIIGHVPESEALLRRVATVQAAARKAGLPIVYVAVGFRPGYPEINERNAMFRSVKESGRLPAKWPNVEVHEAVARRAEEPLVIKHRVSAFAGTDLDVILRAQNAETLILMGVATSGVVLSTVRHASDADYRLIVLDDCCADGDAEVHRCLMEKVFPRQASVIGGERFVGGLGG